jgi:hypothetical protein
MTDQSPVTVQLTLDPSSDPISGEVGIGEQAFAFIGWLNLMQAVEDALAAAQGVGRVIGLPDGSIETGGATWIDAHAT